MSGLQWLWLLLGLPALGAYFVYQWRQKRALRESYAAAAEKLGWKYEESNSDYARRYDGDPFSDVRGRRATNVFQGHHRGRSLTAFEFSYRSTQSDGSGGERTDRRYYQVVAIGSSDHLPFVEVGRHSFLSKLAERAGFGETSTGDAAFDKEFAVSAKDGDVVGSVLTRDVRAWLRNDERTGEDPIRLSGDEVLTWREGRLELADVEVRASFLCDFLDRLHAGRSA